MKKIDVQSVIKSENLVLDNFRIPFVDGTVETPGTFDIGFRDAGLEGTMRTLRFGIMKRNSSQPVCAGIFTYDEETGRIEEDSIEFKLMEVFQGVLGMKICRRRVSDIRKMLDILVIDFGFINAVETANAGNCEKVKASKSCTSCSEKEEKAAEAREESNDMQEDDVYIPILQRKKSYEQHTSPTETRSYTPKVESYDRRGHWRRYKTGKKVWIKPITCHRDK